MEPLEALGFHIVGFGCMTCNGNSGPLPEAAQAAARRGWPLAAVISGNRNFDARIHPDVRLNYLASPPLVVAYALAGTVRVDLSQDALGVDAEGRAVYLRDLWPTDEELATAMQAVSAEAYARAYASEGRQDERWTGIATEPSSRFEWDSASTYIRRPPFLERAAEGGELRAARALLVLGDSITTDHISPVGAIAPNGPAGGWLIERGIAPAQFNSYGSRRGNHEVMCRGTFSNSRLQNLLAPGRDGGFTCHLPTGQILPVFEAAQRYGADKTPLMVIAGLDYGSGSSRDWAAKGTALLGVRCVLARSFERIHRSNLVNIGVLPLQFLPGESAERLGLTGREIFTTHGLDTLRAGELPSRIRISVGELHFEVLVRLDTAQEVETYLAGGLLPAFVRESLR